jgi:hypothetical protein
MVFLEDPDGPVIPEEYRPLPDAAPTQQQQQDPQTKGQATSMQEQMGGGVPEMGQLDQILQDPGIMNALTQGIQENRPGYQAMANMINAAQNQDEAGLQSAYSNFAESLGLEMETNDKDPTRMAPEWERKSQEQIAAFDAFMDRRKERFWEDNWMNLLLKGVGTVALAIGAHNNAPGWAILGSSIAGVGNRAMKANELSYQTGLKEYMQGMTSPHAQEREERRKDYKSIAVAIHEQETADPSRTTPRSKEETAADVKDRLQKMGYEGSDAEVNEVMALMPSKLVYSGAEDEKSRLRESLGEQWRAFSEGKLQPEGRYGEFLDTREAEIKRFPGMRDELIETHEKRRMMAGAEPRETPLAPERQPVPSLSGEERAPSGFQAEPVFTDPQAKSAYTAEKQKYVENAVKELSDRKILESAEVDVGEYVRTNLPEEFQTDEMVSAIESHPSMEGPSFNQMAQMQARMQSQFTSSIEGRMQDAAASALASTTGTVEGKTLGDYPAAMKHLDEYLETFPTWMESQKSSLREQAAETPVSGGMVYNAREAHRKERESGILKERSADAVKKVLADSNKWDTIFSRFVPKLSAGDPTDAFKALSEDLRKSMDQEKMGLNDAEIEAVLDAKLESGLPVDEADKFNVSGMDTWKYIPDKWTAGMLDMMYGESPYDETAWEPAHVTDKEAQAFPYLKPVVGAVSEPKHVIFRKMSKALPDIVQPMPVQGVDGKWNLYVHAGWVGNWDEVFDITTGGVPPGAAVERLEHISGEWPKGTRVPAMWRGGSEMKWRGPVEMDEHSQLYIPLLSEDQVGKMPGREEIQKAIKRIRNHPREMSHMAKIMFTYTAGALSREEMTAPHPETD